MVTFGSEQYVWHSAGAKSHAEPDNPPVASRIMAGQGARVELPKCSVTVLRGKVENYSRSHVATAVDSNGASFQPEIFRSS
jgi:hypothetical protein